MKDFENKKIKILYNTNNGIITQIGTYLKQEGSFLVIIEEFTKKIKYVCLYAIKTVEIMGEEDE